MSDDDWIYPAEIYLLPENANSFGERMSTERRKYIRADLADAAFEAGVKAGLKAAAIIADRERRLTQQEIDFMRRERFGSKGAKDIWAGRLIAAQRLLDNIRTLDHAAIARAAQKEGE